MISRHYDANKLMETMGPYKDELEGFHPKEWLENEENVCLQDGKGNFTLFQRFSPEVVTGHYFLKARGREALNLCKAFLEEIFTGPYNINIIQGITPHDKLGALWMNKKLGFQFKETVDTVVGKCDLVFLTKKQWKVKANG